MDDLMEKMRRLSKELDISVRQLRQNGNAAAQAESYSREMSQE